ncbi:MAG: hypothetical protein F9K16_08900 [Thermoanaerobaculia bacterium]|nr:MAG: hypothetical protein F9K16_08900 [Thermoanaerobaculia bacterium]
MRPGPLARVVLRLLLRAGGPSVAILVALLVGETPPLQAQQYGRWWWDGNLSAGQRQYENLLAGTRLSDYQETTYGLSLGLNGYLGHPALGSFRVGLDGVRTSFEAAAARDSSRIGGSISLSVLPRSRYPFQLALRRGQFDYFESARDTSFSAAAAPKTTDSIAARLRLRAGLLTGTLLGYESNTLRFSDPALADERRSRAFAEWDRQLGGFDNRLRLEQQDDDYSLVDYSLRMLTATFSQIARLGDRWDWQLASRAQRTELDSSAYSSVVDDAGLSGRIGRAVRARDYADLRFDVSAARAGSGTGTRGYGSTFYYRVRPRERFELAPYVQAARLSGEDFSSTSVGTGLSGSWTKSGRVELAVTGALGVASSSTDQLEASTENRQLTWTLGASLATGSPARLRAEIGAEAGHNQLRLSASQTSPVPEPEVVQAGVMDEDYLRARVRLERRQGQRGASGWLDWNLSRGSVPGIETRMERASGSLTVQAQSRNLTGSASAGVSDVSGGAGFDQRIDYAALVTSLRVFRYVDLQASWRADRRKLVNLPDVEASRIEASVVFHAGLLDVRTSAFEARDRGASGPYHVHRGISWGISRALAGWLPIVTGARRRGEIR